MKKILIALTLLCVPAVAHAQNPCTDPPPTGVVLNPTKFYAQIDNYNDVVVGTSTPLIQNFQGGYWPQGQAPTGTPVVQFTVQRSGFTLVAGTTNCYLSPLPATITVENVAYVVYLKAHPDPASGMVGDSAYSGASNPFAKAPTVLAAPVRLTVRQ